MEITYIYWKWFLTPKTFFVYFFTNLMWIIKIIKHQSANWNYYTCLFVATFFIEICVFLHPSCPTKYRAAYNRLAIEERNSSMLRQIALQINLRFPEINLGGNVTIYCILFPDILLNTFFLTRTFGNDCIKFR